MIRISLLLSDNYIPVKFPEPYVVPGKVSCTKKFAYDRVRGNSQDLGVTLLN